MRTPLPLVSLLATILFGLASLPSTTTAADDWGGYALAPVSAPAMVLEANVADGAGVTIGKPAEAPGQKWAIAARDERFFVVHPLSEPGLVLSVRDAGTKNGSAI